MAAQIDRRWRLDDLLLARPEVVVVHDLSDQIQITAQVAMHSVGAFQIEMHSAGALY